jgi:hypothetical protein
MVQDDNLKEVILGGDNELWAVHHFTPRIMSCVCDAGYGDYDCSRPLCPHGDDPLTEEQELETQIFQCNATDGNLIFGYDGEWGASIPFNATAEMVEVALNSMTTVGKISIEFRTVFGALKNVTLPDNSTSFYIEWSSIEEVDGAIVESSFQNNPRLFTQFGTTSQLQESLCLPGNSTFRTLAVATIHSRSTFDTPKIRAQKSGLIDLSSALHGALTVDIGVGQSWASFLAHPKDTGGGGVPTRNTTTTYIVPDSLQHNFAIGWRGESFYQISSAAATTEHIECSGRGTCDRWLYKGSGGKCLCYRGFGSSDGEGGPGPRADCGRILPHGTFEGA